MDEAKSDLIKLVTSGLVNLQGYDEKSAQKTAINIVYGIFTRLENAERVATQERQWAHTQTEKVNEIGAIVKERRQRRKTQGRTMGSYEWLRIEAICRGDGSSKEAC